MNRVKLIIVALIAACIPMHAQTIDLSGEWKFKMDPDAVGQAEGWFAEYDFDELVSLPGSMMTNGKGFDVTAETKFVMTIHDGFPYYTSDEYLQYRREGNVKIPFALQPYKYYTGQAWYNRGVDIPDDWKNKTISLTIERCHWKSTLYIDGKPAGSKNDLCAPQHYDVSGLLTPGRHQITICVDNRILDVDPGVDSHSVSDHTQGNWNGMAGKIILSARPKTFIDRIDVYPELSKGTLLADVTVINSENTPRKATLTVGGTVIRKEFTPGPNTLKITLPLEKNVEYWDEFNPKLYTLRSELKYGRQKDSLSVSYGCREWDTSEGVLKLNGHPAFMRGNVDCCAFPLTGFPPTDTDSWKQIFQIYKDYGLNHARFHSWCPPEAAFQAADEMGIYCYVECSSWANWSVTIGDGRAIDSFIYKEAEAIVREFGNHPSFCMMSYGNEPGGRKCNDFLTDFVRYWQEKDNRRIYTGGAGWPFVECSDWQCDYSPRIQGWGEGIESIINAEEPSTAYDWYDRISESGKPVISHEIGQWCVYPDFKEMEQYKGVYAPRNFEIFREKMEANGLLKYQEDFLRASGKLQSICYKADIEAALRTRDMGGFELLGLNDFPGQGTALVGVVNVFWKDKGYITGKEFSEFCGPLVPLARMDHLIFKNSEIFKADIEIANYERTAEFPTIWSITDEDGKVLGSGVFGPSRIQVSNCQHVGEISFPLSGIRKAEKLVLKVEARGHCNRWNFWVYPDRMADIPDVASVLVTDTLDSAVLDYLGKGGKVLLSLGRGKVAEGMGGEVEVGFSSIFWNTAWTDGCAPHTLGILCDPQSPVLNEFPTDEHCDYQWQDAMSHCSVIRYDKISERIEPSVRVIDDWFTARPLAMMFEVKTGGGSLFISGVDLINDMDRRTSTAQLKYSILKYMTSGEFDPEIEVDIRSIMNITH